MYNRTGSCSRCGECCGFPRSTDSGQNNPWPPDWPSDVRSWMLSVIESEAPMFQITGHPNLGGKGFGTVRFAGNTCNWIWIDGKGLCTDTGRKGDATDYDQRCPCLGNKQPSGQVPCLLVGTNWEFIWQKLCQPVPPVELPDEYYARFIADWHINCPSCSYTYTYQAG